MPSTCFRQGIQCSAELMILGDGDGNGSHGKWAASTPYRTFLVRIFSVDSLLVWQTEVEGDVMPSTCIRQDSIVTSEFADL